MKKILGSEESRRIALETLEEISGIVKQTLGPGGNPIIIQQLGSNPDGTPKMPLITKDGVTVAESVSFRDPAKDTIAKAVYQVAKNTVKESGDGTTTAIVLAEAIYKFGYKHLKQGINGIQLYDDLKNIKNNVIDKINSMKRPATLDDVFNVAKVSSNGDLDVASIVKEALLAAGENGYVGIKDGLGGESSLEVVDGFVYSQGWRSFSSHGYNLVTDKSKNVASFRNPAILLYAGKLDDLQEFGIFLENLLGIDPNTGAYLTPIPLLIIADGYSDDVKERILRLKVQAKMPIAAINAVSDGTLTSKTQILEDLAVGVGGQVAARGILELKDVTDEHLGCADLVEVGMLETVIFGAKGSSGEILSRIEDLKKLKEFAEFDFERSMLSYRIGRLSGGVVVVKAGGYTEMERLEKRDRIEDALSAGRAALQDGVVTGGGLTLYDISKKLHGDLLANEIMKKALEAPIRQIVSNAGENPDVILSHMPYSLGYNAHSRKFEKLEESGILDPAMVVKSALENAVSIAGLLLTTGGSVVNDVPSKDGTPNPLMGLMNV